jgi:hypothetical protein
VYPQWFRDHHRQPGPRTPAPPVKVLGDRTNSSVSSASSTGKASVGGGPVVEMLRSAPLPGKKRKAGFRACVTRYLAAIFALAK